MEVHSFYLDKIEPNKSCLLTLRDIILSLDIEITETQKYGMPCFLYKSQILCYLWVDKKTKEPYILMVEGRQIHHPSLERGDRSRMKIFKVDPEKDLPVESIKEVLNLGLDIYKTGK